MNNVIGYEYCNLGLNNQKFALIGLVSIAKSRGINRISIPKLSSFKPNSEDILLYDFYDFYDKSKINRFFDIFGIEIIDDYTVNTEDPFGCFMAGTNTVGLAGSCGLSSMYDYTNQFFSYLSPLIIHDSEFIKMKKEFLEVLGVKTTVQIRIENDWIEYSKKSLGDEEASFLAVENILKKLGYAENLIQKPIYVVCDESNLPIPKEYIREIARNSYNMDLIWKSDFFSKDEIINKSNLFLSIMDFEMAISTDYFVGTSRSTFSNLVSFEKFCRYKKNVHSDFIYNSYEEKLLARRDNGVNCDPESVSKTPLQRNPLIEVKSSDCRWNVKLLGHISQYGDMISLASSDPGVMGGDLVIGNSIGDGNHIEGISIQLEGIDGLTLKYKVLHGDTGWSDWYKNGDFAGSRGNNRPISGISICLDGIKSRKYDCIYAVKFNDEKNILVGKNSDECFSRLGGAIECIHILFRPATNEWN